MPQKEFASTGKPRGRNGRPSVHVMLTCTNFALIDPPVLLLEEHLFYKVCEFEQAGASGHRRVDTERFLYTFDHKGRLAVPVGLLSRCRALLEEHGYRVKVEDLRQYRHRLHEVDLEFLRGNDGDDRKFLEALIQQPMGQIEARNFKEMVQRITQIRELYPKARIVVSVPTRREAWKLWRTLEDDLDEHVGLAAAGLARHGHRCVVCTYCHLPLAHDADILVLPDAESATRDLPAREATGGIFPRIYGFVQPRRQTHRQTAMLLEALCGPVVYTVTAAATSVRVLMMRTPFCRRVEAVAGLQRKRKAYWRNKPRNKFIASLVQAFVDRDRKELRRLGILAYLANPKTSFRGRGLTIVVESTEHGRELLSLIPSAIMVDAVPRETDEETDPAAAMSSGPVIVAAVVAATAGINTDVVIRASGGASAITIKNFPPAVDKSQPERTVLLLDFNDTFDASAVNDTTQRVRDYEARGFAVTRTITRTG